MITCPVIDIFNHPLCRIRDLKVEDIIYFFIGLLFDNATNNQHGRKFWEAYILSHVGGIDCARVGNRSELIIVNGAIRATDWCPDICT